MIPDRGLNRRDRKEARNYGNGIFKYRRVYGCPRGALRSSMWRGVAGWRWR